MIIFIPDGRLGNQIFQYLALKNILGKREIAIVSGFDELNETFELERVVRFSKKTKFSKTFSEAVYRLLKLIGRLRIINVVCIHRQKLSNGYFREGAHLIRKSGALSFITFLEKGTFHSEKFFDPADVENLKMKHSLKLLAKNRFRELNQKKIKIFIHLRFGDYNSYRVYGKSPILTAQYFRWCMTDITTRYQNVEFLVFSDDQEKAQEILGNSEKLIFIEAQSFNKDFALMTQCDGAILSASSFGWWAAYLLKNKSLVYAPKHWLGFMSSIDYPQHPYPGFFKKIDVLNIEK